MLGNQILSDKVPNVIAINSLMKCGLDNGAVFSLVWGLELLDMKIFPPDLAKAVDKLITDDERISEIQDRDEQKLQRLIFDLNYFLMYEKLVDSMVETIQRIKKEQQARYGQYGKRYE